MAQRQRRDWRDSISIMDHFWQITAVASGKAAVRWSRCWAVIVQRNGRVMERLEHQKSFVHKKPASQKQEPQFAQIQ
jgi:hypothetical protein